MIFRYLMGRGEPGPDAGSKRDEQQREIEEVARKESWLRMLLRRRREARGKPRRHSPANRPGFDGKK